MAARETFEWLANQFWSNPDREIEKTIQEYRKRLMSIRNENERERYVEELALTWREIRKKKPTP